jgi:Ca2+-binding EF-hand superfamily protein
LPALVPAKHAAPRGASRRHGRGAGAAQNNDTARWQVWPAPPESEMPEHFKSRPRRPSVVSLDGASTMSTTSARPAFMQNTFGDNFVDLFDPAQASNVLVRNDAIREQELDNKHELEIALAEHRRSVKKSVAEKNRSQAHKFGQRSLSRRPHSKAPQQEEEYRKNQTFNLMVLNAVTSENAAEDPDLRTNTTPVGTPRETGITSPTPSAAGSHKGSILDHITHKQTRQDRLRGLSVVRKNGQKQKRIQRLLDCRRKEFELKPEKERRALQAAFQMNDKNRSGSLDPPELMDSLVNLGLRPGTDVERRELLRICHEVTILGDVDFLNFCFELVPRVRERLREMRHGPLLLEFKMYDQDGSGKLDERECQQILERLCTSNLDNESLEQMQRLFIDTIKDVADESGQIGFDGFQELVGRAREHHEHIVGTRIYEIYKEHSLTLAELEQHSYELIVLHEAFARADESGDEQLEWEEIGLLLIEYKLLPHNQEEREKVYASFMQVDSDGDGKITFREYLKLVETLRARMMSLELASLKRKFMALDKDQSSRLDMAELAAYLDELGVQPRCREDQLEMRQVLDEADADRSGDLEFTEFLLLVQRVCERLDMALRRRHRVAACKLGIGERRLAELRETFYALDEVDPGRRWSAQS